MFQHVQGVQKGYHGGESSSGDAEPRFICDVMTEGLARQLRLCGIDARSAPVMRGRQRYQAYMELVSSASSEKRVVLTADTVFLRARCVITCLISRSAILVACTAPAASLVTWNWDAGIRVRTLPRGSVLPMYLDARMWKVSTGSKYAFLDCMTGTQIRPTG